MTDGVGYPLASLFTGATVHKRGWAGPMTDYKQPEV